MKKGLGEIIALLLLAGTGVAYFMETYGYRISRFERTGGPGVYPRAILTCLFIFILLRVVQILLSKENRAFVFFNLFWGKKGTFFGMFVLYILLMPFLGYIVATTAYLVAASTYLSYIKEGNLGSRRRLLVRSACFLGATFGIYQFFVVLLDVAVPSGIFASIL